MDREDALAAPEEFHNGCAYPSGATGHECALAGEVSVGGRAHRCISTRTPLGLLTMDARALAPDPCSSLAGRHDNADVISLTRLPVNTSHPAIQFKQVMLREQDVVSKNQGFSRL
jgi:hypothetical protein